MSNQYQDDNIVVIEHQEHQRAAMPATFDMQFILKLLKNPFEALKLDGKRDILYGIIGLAASLIGYAVLSLVLSNYMKKLFFNPLAALLGNSSGMAFDMFMFIGKLILLGIMSLVALLASVWLISMWLGEERPSFQDIITKLGAMQYLTGAGLLLSGIIALMTFKLAMAIFLITICTTLVFTLQAAYRMSRVKEERSALFTICSISGYFVIMLILTSILM